MNHKLLKPQKATEYLTAAVDQPPTKSLASLGENMDPNDAEFEHKTQQQQSGNEDWERKKGSNEAKLFKLQIANQCLTIVAGLPPEVSTVSLD